MKLYHYISFLLSCLILVVLLMLGASTIINMFFNFGSPREERIAMTPDFSLQRSDVKSLLSEIRLYLQKRYALKDSFIRANSTIKREVFGHIPSQSVLRGENGFLFLNDENAIAQVQGADYPQTAPSETWRGYFQALDQELKNRAIPFAFILAPNKHTVYQEALPDWLRPMSANVRNISDIVLGEAGSFLSGGVVNIEQVLNKALSSSPEDDLYYKTDTHWNVLGASLAIKASLRQIGFDIDVSQLREDRAGRGGDLARIVGIEHKVDEIIQVFPKGKSEFCRKDDGKKFVFEVFDPLPIKFFTCKKEGVKPLKVLLFMDSFGLSAVPVFLKNFKETHFFWQDAVDLNLVDSLNPDLVVQILAERKVQTIDPDKLLILPR